MRRSLSGACLTALATLISAGVSNADVTMEQRMSVEGTGIMSAGNMSGTTRTTISGEHSRSDSDLQLQSRVVRMLAHGAGGPSADIVLLDQDKIYHLDLKKKTYTETTFAELRARFQQAAGQASQDAQQNPQQNPAPVDDSQCEWLDPKVQVNQTGEKATIAGFEAQRLTVSASQPCRNRKTGAICEMALGLDEWLAPQFTANEEATRFQRAYAQKMGFDTAYSRDVSERAQKLFARYKGVWTELATKMKDMKGYPVKMSFALAFGGPQCKDNSSDRQQTADESASPPSQSPPTSPGGLMGQLGGKLAGSLLHRKKEPAADTSAGGATAAGAAAPASALPPGLVPLVTLSSELVSVSQDAVSPTVFTVPADFKKIDEGRK